MKPARIEYGKIETTFWTTPPESGGVAGLEPHVQALAAYLRTSEHRNIIGTMRLATAYIVGDLGWHADAINDAISTLSKVGYIVRDAHGWTHVPAQLVTDAPGVPNHWKAAIKLADLVPRSSPVFASLVRQLNGMADASPLLSAWLVDAMAMVSTMASGMASTGDAPKHPNGIGDGTRIPAPAPAPAVPPSADAKPRPGAATPVPLKADWLPDAIDLTAAKLLKLPDGAIPAEAAKFRKAALASGEARDLDGWRSAWMTHCGAVAAALVDSTPIDLKAEIFKRGKALLTRLGVQPKQAGAVLGKWRKDHGNAAVLDALTLAEAESPSEPIAYIEGILRRNIRNGKRIDPAEQERQDSLSVLRGMGYRPDGGACDAHHREPGGHDRAGHTGDNRRAESHGRAAPDGRDSQAGSVVSGDEHQADERGHADRGVQAGAQSPAPGPADQGLRGDQEDAHLGRATAAAEGDRSTGERRILPAGEDQGGPVPGQPGAGGDGTANDTGAESREHQGGGRAVGPLADESVRLSKQGEDLLDIPAFLRRTDTPVQVH
jgi:hypothetical protein